MRNKRRANRLLAAGLAACLLTGCVQRADIVRETLTEDEQSVLTAMYQYDEAKIERGQLSDAEKELLDLYRFFKQYMEQEHPAIEWHLVWISTRSGVSPTGEPYDTVIFWTESPEQSETVKIDRDGPEVIWDSLSNALIPTGEGSQSRST